MPSEVWNWLTNSDGPGAMDEGSMTGQKTDAVLSVGSGVIKKKPLIQTNQRRVASVLLEGISDGRP